MNPAKDTLFRGEFEVVKELVATMKDGQGAKNNAAQAFLKSKIMDNIHKYFYLIVFAGYMRDQAAIAREAIEADKKAAVALPASGKCSIPATELKVGETFVQFMEKNS